MKPATHPLRGAGLQCHASQAGKTLPRLLVLMAAGAGALVALLILAAALVYPTLPALDKLTDYNPKQPLRVFTADGQLMAEYGAERRQYLPLAQIPQRMQDALLAVEDSAFYEHSGISLTGIARAALSNLFSSRSQGASTITQQLARDAFLTKKKLYTRKFVEVLLALKIEGELSKDKILEVYMNQIYLGQRAYGFAAASEIYFGKPLAKLSLAETAMLAGLPQNPGYANPIVNFQRAKRRQLIVLDRMHDIGKISAAQWEQAKQERLQVRSPQDFRLHAEFAAEMARQVVYAQYGDETYTRGLRVTTTVLAEPQAAAYKALRKTLMEHERRKPYRGPESQAELPDDPAEMDTAITQLLSDHPDQDDLRAAVITAVDRRGGGSLVATLQSGEEVRLGPDALRSVQAHLGDKLKPSQRLQRGSVIRVMRGTPSKADPLGAWQLAQVPEAEGALVSLDPSTGKVLALVGGFDFGRNQFNHATQAWRQPGSSFKPLVYSAALEQGFTPDTVVDDAPLNFDGWEPRNSDGQFDGPMSLRTALARSKNMVTLRVLEQIGPAKAAQWAARFGLDEERQPKNLTLGLGTGAVTPLQMASAYAVFANGGHLLKPLLITRITDSQGQVLFEAKPTDPSEESRAIPERNAFVTAQLLQEVTRSGTAARAQGSLRRPDLYGKTGTTNEAVDAWFAGFQPGVVAVVWVGYDAPRSLGDRESGGGLALPAWIDYMAVALRGRPVQELTPPATGLLRQGEGWVFEEFAGGAASAPLHPASAASAAALASSPL